MKTTTFLVYSFIFLFGCSNAKFGNTGQNLPDNQKAGDSPNKGICEGKHQRLVLFENGIKNRNYIMEVRPVLGNIDPVANYNYKKLSANLIVGPKMLRHWGQHFMYQYKDDLFLYILLGKSHKKGKRRNISVNLKITENDHKDKVQFSDEFDEMKLVDYSKKSSYYQGDFLFSKNSDGAVVGPLRGKNFEVQISYIDFYDLNGVVFYDQSEGHQMISNKSTTGKAFTIKYSDKVPCQ